ncbi:hypothetical protein ABG768_019130, partial [Culter alburnus]
MLRERESDPAQWCGSYSRTPTHPPPASSNRYMCGPSKLAGVRPQWPSPTPVARAAKRPQPHKRHGDQRSPDKREVLANVCPG